jgi:hypothetical protein
MQTFSGIVSLLNDFRLSQGKSSLGFLNPLLYSTGAAGLNDITSGNNPGCDTNGFSAGTGWDPVSDVPSFLPFFLSVFGIFSLLLWYPTSRVFSLLFHFSIL